MQDTPPNPYQIDRGYIVKEDGDRGGAQYKRAGQLPLDYYLAQGRITPKQHRAGRRFESLWATSQHQHKHVQYRYQEYEGGTNEFEARFLISVEFVEASNAIRGKDAQSIACWVCLKGERAGRGKMHHLASALDDLAAHFALRQKPSNGIIRQD